MLRPGDVVTDLEEDSIFQGKQGIVVATQLCLWGEPEVTVHIDRALYPMHLRDDEYPNGFYEVYSPCSLRRDTDWEPEVYARRLFKDRWHHIRILNIAFNPQSLCLVEGCNAHQQQTIWFNIWGTVCNAYVCQQHARHYHGLCGDVFPWRRKARKATA